MCRISSIQMLTMVLVYLKGLLGIIVSVIGMSFVSDINLHEAFTTQFKEYGGGLVVLGLISWLAVLLQNWATVRHNRFMLVFCFFLDTIVLASQFHVGRTVTSYTYPDFPKVLQEDCLRNVPEVYTLEECLPYLKSDRVAGMRLYWEFYYSDRINKSSFQKITTAEGDICCGFYAPLGCVPDPSPFPLNRDISGIDVLFTVRGQTYSVSNQRTLCGDVPNVDNSGKGYYPSTDECLHYSDLNAVPPIIGGCIYDMGLGYCIEKKIKADGSSAGCASVVEDIMKANIESTGFMLAFLTLINVFAMFLECCMWWKRKEIDVLPNTFVKMAGKQIDYNAVPNQFEVKPVYEVLAKRRFLPMPRHLKLELARQAEEEAALAAIRLKEQEALEDEVK